jgi:hypothetical protein
LTKYSTALFCIAAIALASGILLALGIVLAAFKTPLSEQGARGIHLWPNGDKYEGEYRDGKPNGQGIYTWADGRKYVGEWKDGKKHGQGTFTSPTSGKYAGEYRDDKKNGQGNYTRPNGDKYVGEFRDDDINGQGTYTGADGRKYEGDFRWGKRNGQGTETLPNGSKYVQEWMDGKPIGDAKRIGQGTYTPPGAQPTPTPGAPARDIKFATNTISVRACDAQANAIVEKLGSGFQRQGVNAADLRGASRNMCLAIEQEKYEKVQYTLPVVPQVTANVCALIMASGQPPSYERMSNCLDGQLAQLETPPRGSASLQKAGQKDRLFWTFEECQIFRDALGGACIIH